MTVTYNMTRDDYIHFNLYHIEHSPSLRKRRNWSHFTMVFVFILLALFPIGVRNLLVGRVYFGAFAILAFLLFPKWWQWSIKRNMGKIMNEGKDVSLSTQTTLTSQTEGLHIEGEKANGTIKWNGIEKVESSSSHTFLYTGAANAIVIPNTAFESVAEREKFVETVMQYRENAAGISAVLA